MSKGKLIVIEGACDGVGKTTQYNKLNDYLVGEGYSVIRHHFPSYGTEHGRKVEEYLAGKLGDKYTLSPYFINSLYAEDREWVWHHELKQHYDDGGIVLLDRYTTSSIIYQGSVIKDLERRKKFIDYVTKYEYQQLNIASPDLVIFLNADFDLVAKLRRERANNDGIVNDIHEADTEYQRLVYENALFVADYLGFDIVECCQDGKMRSIDSIHNEIKTKVRKKIKE